MSPSPTETPKFRCLYSDLGAVLRFNIWLTSLPGPAALWCSHVQIGADSGCQLRRHMKATLKARWQWQAYWSQRRRPPRSLARRGRGRAATSTRVGPIPWIQRSPPRCRRARPLANTRRRFADIASFRPGTTRSSPACACNERIVGASGRNVAYAVVPPPPARCKYRQRPNERCIRFR